MRLLAEIVIIGALIYFGWNKPFKEQVAQASTTIESKLHGAGSKLQKHQDPSVRRDQSDVDTCGSSTACGTMARRLSTSCHAVTGPGGSAVN